MNQDVLLDALMAVACKRRLLGSGAAARLRDLARLKGVANLDDARRWLESGDGLSAHLANQLRTLLSKPDDRPFGGYVPLAHLADGGMGSVWLAAAPDNRLVVVKTLRREATQGKAASVVDEFRKRFEREARITQQLAHPNVVRCLDSGAREDGTLFMVLEYVDSGDLRDLIDLRGGLAEGLALAIIYQVVDGLAEAHRLHLVHRDIKPANIFVGHDGRAKLADFGIARSTESDRTMLTMEGAVVGSPLYMSPEQILGDPSLDVRSDIYALGAVLFYCLAAAPPYEGKMQEVLHKHCTASPPDIRRLRPVVGETTARILSTCLAKERAKRYADPAEMRAALADDLVKLGLTPGQAIEEDTRQGDLSGKDGSGFRPIIPDDATVATDLSSAATATLSATVGTMVQEPHTIVADLLAQAEAAPKPAATSHTDPTMVLPSATPAVPAAQEAVEGDLAAALAADWLTLAPEGGGDSSAVMLFARPRLCLGKLREAPIDLCLRNYPVMANKEQCQRISRQHLTLAYDLVADECVIEDLGGANGSMLDGVALKPGHPWPLAGDQENILLVANVVALRLRCLRRPGRRARAAPAIPSHGSTLATPALPAVTCGIESDLGFDAVLVTRPENRPELAYAMVLRRLTVGGPGAQLSLAGARTRASCEIGVKGGRWIWRAAAEQPWRPLTAQTELDCGGRRMKARAGEYPQFD